MSQSPTIIAIDGPSASGKGTVAKRLAAHFDFALLDTGLLYRAVGMALVTAGIDPANADVAEKAALALGKFYLDIEISNGTPPSLTLPVHLRVEGRESDLSRERWSSSPPAGEVRWGGDQQEIKFDFADLLTDTALRGDAASTAASKVAAIPSVRAALLKFQQDFCARPPGGKKGAVLDGRDIGTVIAPQAQVKIYVTASVEARSERRFKELQGRGENTSYEAVLKDLAERDARDAGRAVAPAKPADDAVIIDTTPMNADQAFAEALRVAKKKID